MTAQPMAVPGPGQPVEATGPTVDVTGPTVAWIRCVACSALVYRKRLRRNLDVCPECGDPHRLTAPERIRQLVDTGTFVPLGNAVAPGPLPADVVDPLTFVDSMAYPDRVAAARIRTGLTEAVLCGQARIGGRPVVLAVMDFRFLGGSLGCAVGALITEAAERALARHRPLVLVTASGGARMQEGALALMQMAAVSQAIAALREAGPLTISVVTDPTYGGVAASFATNTDVVLVESGARMGFAGPRVIRQTIGQQLPEGFQTAPFLLRHGQVDLVVERHRLRTRLAALLAFADGGPVVREADPAGPVVREADPAGPVGVEADPAGPVGADGTPVLIRDPDRLPVPDAWRDVRRARQTDRPTTLDYLSTAFDGFVELHGDRIGADCPAIVAGLAWLAGHPVVVVGHQKGHRTADLLARNFGMSSPAGYRKAQRVMRLAVRLGVPVVTLIDTPGAHPGVDAERHGQAAAIADCILTMTGLPVPVVAVITGEGGSGGALALAVADQVLMLEHAVYSVISPEGCAAILWNDPVATAQAAHALRLTAPDLLRLGVADAVVPEPGPGAHSDPATAAALLRRGVREALRSLSELDGETLVRRRRARFRRYATAVTAVTPPEP
jgi:acetyl-CoA carboxylase carboxyl transferase subunit beta